MARSLNARFKSIPYITLPGTFILLSPAASHPLRSTPGYCSTLCPSLFARVGHGACNSVRHSCRTVSLLLSSCDRVCCPRDRFSDDPYTPVDSSIYIKRSRSAWHPKRRNVRTREMQALRCRRWNVTVQHRNHRHSNETLPHRSRKSVIENFLVHSKSDLVLYSGDRFAMV